MIAYICLLVCLVPLAASGPCESEDWFYHDGNCYWASIYTLPKYQKRNWFGAARDCRIRDADLVSIQSLAENQFVHKMTRCSSTWNGLIKSQTAASSHVSYEWIDGSRRKYVNFLSGQPNSAYPCTEIYSSTGSNAGRWVTRDGDSSDKFYVCKKKSVNVSNVSDIVHPSKVRGACRDGWYQRGIKCYQVNTTKVDFFEAMMQCEHIKGNLVTVHSQNEFIDLLTMFNTCGYSWIGLENVVPGKVGSDSGWKWADYSSVDFSLWSYRYKDQQKQCGRLEDGAAGWRNVYCWEKYPFVCEYKL